ncbi:hypothetical protein SISSUDRAFT_1034500 [Sistotremastrum suecicum HHB10207 ss-3]|uniref:Uncharacterized protein n=1 Tax=Sistotremastrum suecicum HHB10207 ss-3 TaxID=1314776 RepID=A0A166BZF0_9AGAM|nr:hypothetical protein SISSUDRAFT_1034500 [Sistotremastrum suecicum HHB10207 ss-3]
MYLSIDFLSSLCAAALSHSGRRRQGQILWYFRRTSHLTLSHGVMNDTQYPLILMNASHRVLSDLACQWALALRRIDSHFLFLSASASGEDVMSHWMISDNGFHLMLWQWIRIPIFTAYSKESLVVLTRSASGCLNVRFKFESWISRKVGGIGGR